MMSTHWQFPHTCHCWSWLTLFTFSSSCRSNVCGNHKEEELLTIGGSVGYWVLPQRNPALGGESQWLLVTYHHSPPLHIVLHTVTLFLSMHSGQMYQIKIQQSPPRQKVNRWQVLNLATRFCLSSEFVFWINWINALLYLWILYLCTHRVSM